MSVETELLEHEQHPFFHTMVVMGSALALGCGGMSNPIEPERTASGGSGGGGSGGGGSGGAGSTGGMPGAGTGGAQIIIGQAGSGQTPVEPGPFVCSPAQWVCSSSYSACDGNGFRLPNDCGCDESRPKTPADCAAGESLVCRRATATNDGRPLTEAVLFACECAKDQASCEVACDLVFYDSGNCIDQMEDGGGKSVLCGCAVIVLR